MSCNVCNCFVTGDTRPLAKSIANVWKYNCKYNSWHQLPSLPDDRGGGALAEVDGKLHFVGGATFITGRMFVKDHVDHWTLDLKKTYANWKAAKAIPSPGRNHLGATGHGGKLYVFGGQLLEEEWTTNHNLAHVYDPQTNSWKKLANMPYKLGHISPSVIAHGGGIFVVGGATNGHNNHNPSALLFYHVGKNEWSKVSGAPNSIKGSSQVSGIINSKLHVQHEGKLFVGSITGGAKPKTYAFVKHEASRAGQQGEQGEQSTHGTAAAVPAAIAVFILAVATLAVLVYLASTRPTPTNGKDGDASSDGEGGGAGPMHTGHGDRGSASGNAPGVGRSTSAGADASGLPRTVRGAHTTLV